MKAVLVIDSISRAAGGLLDAERCLHQGLRRMGVRTAVFALEDAHTPDDLPGWTPLSPKVFPHQGPSALGWSADLRQAIIAQSADIIYRAGLWRLPSRYAHEWRRMHGRPEIITPHGMLDPWAVRNSRWKKRLAHLWFEGAHLREASCIRALCESEAQAIRSYGLKNPICVIPNGVEMPEEPEEELSVVSCQLSVEEGKSQGTVRKHNRQQTTDNGPRILLFLGRLHPKKGLVNALRAWKQALHSTSNIQHCLRPCQSGLRQFPASPELQPRSTFHEWQFVVAGWDQGGHEAELKRLCDDLGLCYSDVPAADYVGGTPTLLESSSVSSVQSVVQNSSSVIFIGPAFGATKDLLLRRAHAFILPSFSEGLPMSVLEAWAYCLPVLMTEHCNLPEGFASDAALRIGTDVASIAEGLRLLHQSTIHDLQSLGRNGRALVKRQFAWPQVAAQMKEVYEWVLGGGEVPDCVRKF